MVPSIQNFRPSKSRKQPGSGNRKKISLRLEQLEDRNLLNATTFLSRNSLFTEPTNIDILNSPSQETLNQDSVIDVSYEQPTTNPPGIVDPSDLNTGQDSVVGDSVTIPDNEPTNNDPVDETVDDPVEEPVDEPTDAPIVRRRFRRGDVPTVGPEVPTEDPVTPGDDGNDNPGDGGNDNPDDNQGLTLETNSSMTVSVRGRATITNAHLKTTYPGKSAREIWYKVVDLPKHGTLRRNFVPVFIGSSFSQAEIDSGRITYSHDGSAIPVDGFSFDVHVEGGESLFRTFIINPGGGLPQIAMQPTMRTFSYQLAESGALLGMNTVRSDSRFAGVDGSGFSTVIIDSGIDVDHPHFGPDADGNGIADRIVFQFDYGDNDGDATDTVNHGSNVSSIALSEDPVLTGMAPGSNIIALKVGPDGGGPSSGAIEAALWWVAANVFTYNIASVNMSLGGGNDTAPVSDAFLSDVLSFLTSLDVIVVSASGNSFNSMPGVAYPSSDVNSLSIGAVWDADVGGGYVWNTGEVDFSTGPDRITSGSQRHPSLTDIFAPGGAILAANDSGGIWTFTPSGTYGTSMASPHVAGIATLAQQYASQVLGRRLTFAEFRTMIRDTGVTIYDGDDEDDNVTNTNAEYKRIDVFALLEFIERLIPPTLIGDGGFNDTSDRAANLGFVPSGLQLTGQSIARNSNGLHDHDWFHFTAGQNAAVTVTLGNIRTLNRTDLHFRIFRVINGRLIQITSSTQLGWLETQSATFDTLAGVRYYIWVFGYNFEQGDYDLSIQY